MNDLYENNAKKRLVIYAAFDEQNSVDLSDIYYLNELRKVADTIIYVADNELNGEEEDKLKGLADYVLAQRHGEYDFGSYKRGFFYAKENGLLDNIDELILCNDSCYAPLHPFAPIFETMQEKNCDFWGLVENYEIAHHLQSFFLSFRPKVFNSDAFVNFFASVEAQKNVQDVIQKYEIGLSSLLFAHGFCGESFISYPTDRELPCLKGRKTNLTGFPIWLINKGCPLLKKKAMYDLVANKDGFVKTRYIAIKHNEVLLNVLPSFSKVFFADAMRYKHFVFQKKITKKGKLIIKIFKIPVWSKKVSV